MEDKKIGATGVILISLAMFFIGMIARGAAPLDRNEKMLAYSAARYVCVVDNGGSIHTRRRYGYDK